ncbi:hypothetical protein JCM24511_01024 [Saitozyma sp. JCM 24511]|nr:hypothetical protein JCM24511_01024 [Saitozyma sp. JCM 24511]
MTSVTTAGLMEGDAACRIVDAGDAGSGRSVGVSEVDPDEASGGCCVVGGGGEGGGGVMLRWVEAVAGSPSEAERGVRSVVGGIGLFGFVTRFGD